MHCFSSDLGINFQALAHSLGIMKKSRCLASHRIKSTSGMHRDRRVELSVHNQCLVNNFRHGLKDMCTHPPYEDPSQEATETPEQRISLLRARRTVTTRLALGAQHSLHMCPLLIARIPTLLPAQKPDGRSTCIGWGGCCIVASVGKTRHNGCVVGYIVLRSDATRDCVFVVACSAADERGWAR